MFKKVELITLQNLKLLQTMQQKFYYFFLVLLVLFNSFCYAQTTVNIKLEDQYGTAIKDAQITVVGSNTNYTTNEEGLAQIEATTTDNISVTKKYFNNTPIAISTAKNGIIVMEKGFSWSDIINPKFYIIHGGLWLLLFVVFAETGLFAGFFLPGDSLLFVAGIYSSELIVNYFPFIQGEYIQLLLLWLFISIAGIIGNSVGYWFGQKVGPAMYNWKENFLFKKRYLQQAHDFYEKHGGGAIIFARFIPIVRTFAPIVAGIVQMDKKKFSFYNILGSFLWVFLMLIAGHFLQKWILNQFGFNLKEHLEVIVIGIVLITTAPVIIKLATGKKG